jgi:hypothetical protein
MIRLPLLAAFVLLPHLFALAHSADLALRKIDCEQILQRWAEDPNTVPRDIVQRCREKLNTSVLADVRENDAQRIGISAGILPPALRVDRG